jgi:hypothetical protein
MEILRITGHITYENGKMRSVESTLRLGGSGIKENYGSGEFN